jgi:hypothetical protein
MRRFRYSAGLVMAVVFLFLLSKADKEISRNQRYRYERVLPAKDTAAQHYLKA